MSRLDAIGFDADDTLWHNETFFQMTQAHFAELLADHAERDHLMDRLLEAERRNLGIYGFGIKGFVLSMIETAVEVTEGRVPASVIGEILAAGREMLAHPVDLLPHARETVEALARDHRLVLITKGDLLDQERKLAQSGLGDLFDAVEIVSEKTSATYARAFAPEGSEAALMVGNSMRSDVRPAIEAGAWGVFCPSELEWELERAEAPDHPRYRRIAHLGELPDLIAAL
ncbi:HAD family hydrolase [Jannaschia aquimarina]|uniref:DUMP phosphatase n=1 Tax=Jannaschia aquimarina TaxID=935700 RepID=A0A0D1EK85_9RHOB|nr:HAD family hydrolase [Jannaschia aquimarina]KIT17421.1 dUMP phosphatase [Jannaschia aquimarina]SNT24093.1 putative hydrolase of the HAD superfamily [Jannaschia aquimarina]